MALPSWRTIGALLVAAAATAPAWPDEILLRNGGRISGVVVEKTARAVVIETGPGRVTLPLSRVERIVEGRSALDGYRERAAELASGDVEGWAALARWAAERELVTQSRQAWQRVLATDPSHPEANAALGRVELNGAWMAEDDAYRARGFVSFEGRWVTPVEHAALLRERESEAAAALEQREADLRVREAEARVREAEARAEAAAQQPMDGGIPLGYAYGGYGYGGYGWGGGGGVPPLVGRPPMHPRPPMGPHAAGSVHPNPPTPPHNPRPTPRSSSQPERSRPQTAAVIPPSR